MHKDIVKKLIILVVFTSFIISPVIIWPVPETKIDGVDSENVDDGQDLNTAITTYKPSSSSFKEYKSSAEQKAWDLTKDYKFMQKKAVESANGEIQLIIIPKINSQDNLLQYKEQRLEELKEILDLPCPENREPCYYKAAVTFSNRLTKQGLDELIKKYQPFGISDLTYTSTVGGGKIPLDMLENKELLDKMEERLRKEQLKHNGIENFKLIEGFSSFWVYVYKDQVLKLQNDSRVFLVDVGPKELFTNEVSKAKWESVHHEASRYLLQKQQNKQGSSSQNEKSRVGQSQTGTSDWLPIHQGPYVEEIAVESWQGSDNYVGYFLMSDKWRWSEETLENMRAKIDGSSDRCTNYGNNQVVYELRRRQDQESWDGVWAKAAYEPKPETFFYTDFPSFNNKGCEEAEGWFWEWAIDDYFDDCGWYEACYQECFWQCYYFASCQCIDKPCDPTPWDRNGCDEEYEVMGNVWQLQPDHAYLIEIMFRIDTNGVQSTELRSETELMTPEYYHYYGSCTGETLSDTQSTWFIDPANPDSDLDGLMDWWEYQYFGDLSHGPSEDYDGDGLTNLQEYENKLNPTSATEDKDADGVPDSWEVIYGLNYLDPNDATGDLDGDGLSNLEEYNLHTNPQSSDTDSDGLPDKWEIDNGLDPTSATGDDGKDSDPDQDCFTNYEEYLYGGDPLKPCDDLCG